MESLVYVLFVPLLIAGLPYRIVHSSKTMAVLLNSLTAVMLSSDPTWYLLASEGDFCGKHTLL